MNKENSVNLAIKCESPLSPQSRRLRLKRPYLNDEDGPRAKIYHETNDYQRYGNEENEEVKRNFQGTVGTRPEFVFAKEHLRVLRNQYYFSPRWRQNMPFRNLADRNGNNLLMIAPAQNGKDESERKMHNGHGSKEKMDKDGK